MSATEGHFKSNNHAMSTGMLVAHLLSHGVAVEVEIADNGQDYTPRLVVVIPDLEHTVAFDVLPPSEDVL